MSDYISGWIANNYPGYVSQANGYLDTMKPLPGGNTEAWNPGQGGGMETPDTANPDSEGLSDKDRFDTMMNSSEEAKKRWEQAREDEKWAIENAQKFNHQEAIDQREWAERMDSTKYQRLVKDLRAAGINPLVYFSGGGQAGSVPQGATATQGGIGNFVPGSFGETERMKELIGFITAIAFGMNGISDIAKLIPKGHYGKLGFG